MKVEILRGDEYRDRLDGFEIDAVSKAELIVRSVNESTFRKTNFRSEQDPTNIGWKTPELGVLHVIECSGKFSTFEEVSRHLHIGRTFIQELEFKKMHGVEIWDEGGAMKVLVASLSSGVPTFDPGVNERDCRFQDYILGCAPPKHLEKESDMKWDLETYSLQVLKLLSELGVTSQRIIKFNFSRCRALTSRRRGTCTRWLACKLSSELRIRSWSFVRGEGPILAAYATYFGF